MPTHSAIGLALVMAALEELPAKKKLRILKRTSQLLGARGVVPITSKRNGQDPEATRAVWEAMLPKLLGDA